mgnify:CR=1 FL=1|tara:strand:+ start:6622 stop:7797 length:1176 start_codon:yes stop_codon:yes gene_type:complete
MRRVNLEQFKNKKIALVLSGGVVKASAWHLGVGLALEELGFNMCHNESKPSSLDINTYVGSSAGALVGLYLASGFSPMDVIEAQVDGKSARLKPITYKDMLSFRASMKRPPKGEFYDPLEGFPTMLKKVLNPLATLPGFFTTEGLRQYLDKHVLKQAEFSELKTDFFVVATQLDHSRKVIFGKYNYPNPHHDSTACYYTGIPISESVAASMSVPPFYSPYPIFNPQTNHTDYYIDGEIRETLSTHVAIDHGCEFVISSWTHTPYHYVDEVGSLVNYGLPAICTQAIYLMIQKKIVANRALRAQSEDIIDTVNEYMRTNKFDEKHRKKLTGILERKLHFNPNVHMIDIYPKHTNYRTFFKNSFSLNPDKLSEVVSSGYKRTMEVFRHHEWEN